VCVVGKVVKPLDLSFKDGLTLTDAIEEAGGIVPGSKNIRVLVFSSGPGNQGQIIDVDVKAIEKKQKPDLKLQRLTSLRFYLESERKSRSHLLTHVRGGRSSVFCEGAESNAWSGLAGE
jgi:protein involved in polysaccharide export with SLBB domain